MTIVKRHKLPVARSMTMKDIMYNMINTINMAAYYILKVIMRVNHKNSHQKKKSFFSVSLILYLYEMMDVC